MKKSSDRGLFQRRGSPYWWIRYADKSGKIRRESTCTTQKKLAREILAKRRVQVAENRNLDVKKVPKTTFFQLCNHYWEIEGRLSRTKGLESAIELWKRELGTPPVSEMSQQRIQRFLVRHMEDNKLSPATHNRHLAMLSSMFNKGIQWGLVAENPTRGIKSLRETGARTRFLDQDEIRRLLAAASAHFRPILTMALHTGMRRGEIMKLEWSDVDLRNRVLRVREAKSGKQRTIRITDTLHGTLRGLTSRFKKVLVFPSPVTGNRWTDFRRQFRNAVNTAKIEDFRFHDLRHAFASHLVMGGVDIRTVQELMGHASITMTMKYSHLAPIHRQRAIQILDSAYQTDTETDTVDKTGTDQSS